MLWLDKNATTEFSSRVDIMDVNELVGSMENEAIFTQISGVVEKADLLRYEVLLLERVLPPINSCRLCSNMGGYTLTWTQ